MSDPASREQRRHHGTCPACGRLKHVTADGHVRLHNSYTSAGGAVATVRCAGSGEPMVPAPGSA